MIIAEIGQAHDGSVGILHSYIDAVASTGADAIKFQTHIAEAESSAFEPFRKKFSYVDKTRFDYWKRMELSFDQWKEIKDHCEEVGLQFLSSPFSCAAVDLLEKLGIEQYKVGSGEVTNHLLLDTIASTGKPVILSSGMSTLEELDSAVEIFKTKKTPVSLLQCTTAYPTHPQDWGLHIINIFKNRYNIPIGFSDHSGDIFACLAAAAIGAAIFEFHVVFDKRMFGPDAKASIEIDDAKRLVKGIRQIQTSLNNTFLKNEKAEGLKDLKKMFGKSLAINKDLPAGHILSLEDLEAKKPAEKGIAADSYREVIGAMVNRNMKKSDFLEHGHIQFYD